MLGIIVNHRLRMLKITFIKDLTIDHSTVQVTYKRINQYPTDVFNSYKINKTHNVKKTL